MTIIVVWRNQPVTSRPTSKRGCYHKHYYHANKLSIALRRKERRKDSKALSRRIFMTIPPVVRERISSKSLEVELRMERLKNTLDSVGNYRKFYRKNFPMEWSFTLGYSTYTLGCNGFKEKHNIEVPPFTGLGRNLKNPMEKDVPAWQKDLYLQVKELFALIVPYLVEKQFMLHVGKMSTDKHNVPLHDDAHDIGPQGALFIGDWKGAKLRCYKEASKKSTSTSEFVDLFETMKIWMVDGRLPHQVIKEDFKGVRYSIIVYRLWNEDVNAPESILYPPHEVKM
jgi:hypothetical protein